MLNVLITKSFGNSGVSNSNPAYGAKYGDAYFGEYSQNFERVHEYAFGNSTCGSEFRRCSAKHEKSNGRPKSDDSDARTTREYEPSNPNRPHGEKNLKEDPMWLIYEKGEWVKKTNGGDRPNTMPLFSQCDSYDNWGAEMKRR